MPRPIKSLPTEGDRVKLRGRDAVGVLHKLGGPERKWASVRWDVKLSAPGLVHLHELEIINQQLPTEEA